MQDVIQFNGKEVKMTFGLLNILCRMVGDVDVAALMTIDGDLREQMIIQTLSPRDAKGIIISQVSVFEIEASTDEFVILLDWIQEHVLSFFVQTGTKTAQVVADLQKKVVALQALLPGGAS